MTGWWLWFWTGAAQLAVGNVLPISAMPEGTIACNLEQRVGDRGKLARSSGDYVTIIGHQEDAGKTKIRLPSGMKKTIDSRCVCGAVGVFCGRGGASVGSVAARARVASRGKSGSGGCC